MKTGTDGSACTGSDDDTAPAPIGTTLPYTDRMPDCVGVHESGALVCQGCGKRYQTNGTSMPRAIVCCNSIATVDRDDLGLDPAAIEDLVADGLLTRGCEYPHRLYGVTVAGREAIGEALVEGVDYGDGVGDLGETSHHRRRTALGKRWFEAELVADDDAPAVEAVRYHPVDAGRLDVAALDAPGCTAIYTMGDLINRLEL